LRRSFKITLLSFVATVLTIVAVLLFPQKLFAYKMTYKEFTVCSNSKVDSSINFVLDNAMGLVKRSELYDSFYHYNIILCHNTFYNKIDNLLGSGATARPRLHNVIIKVRIDPQNNKAFPTFPDSCEVNLTILITHEMIHCLQANKYGTRKINPFNHPPFWKLEGYSEYVSKQTKLSGSDYNFQKEIDRYINYKNRSTDGWILSGEDGCRHPDYYFKGRLMVEYLMNVRHLSYDQIFRDTISENVIYNDMIKWKDSTTKN